MNIHELNENGQSLWVFILRTVLIVGTTLVIWGAMYQFQKYNSLPKKSVYYNEGKSWPTRLHRLLQLVFHGHIIWAWKSGVLVSLLTDGRVAFRRSCLKHEIDLALRPPPDESRKLCHNAHWSCDYIKGHLEIRRAFKCSNLETQFDGKREESIQREGSIQSEGSIQDV